MQVITREGFELNAAMNTQMTERFNVSGAQLVKLFGDYDREVDQFSDRAGKVRDIGVRGAMYGRAFFIALALVAAVGTAAVYGIGGNLVISGTHQRRHPGRPGRLRDPDLRTRSPPSPTPGSTS